MSNISAVARMETTQSAMDVFVRALAKCCNDKGVRSDISSKLVTIRVVAAGDHRPKGIWFDRDVLVYSCIPTAGISGTLSRKEVLLFFEDQFYAQERELVTKFIHVGLPEAERRLRIALGRQIKIDMDLVTLLGQCSAQRKRLDTARTIVTRTKMVQKATSKARQTFNSVVTKANAIAGKFSEEKKETAADLECNSPNVLLPLIEAFEYCCQIEPRNATTLAAAVGQITFVLVSASKDKKSTLTLHQSIGTPAISPSPVAAPVVQDGVLVYSGHFEAGYTGCFSKAEVINFLEGHFRCQEQSKIKLMMAEIVPAVNARLGFIHGHPMELEVVWPAILHPALKLERRLEICSILTDRDSKLVVGPLVDALEIVIRKADYPTNGYTERPTGNILKQISQIVLTSQPGKAARPSLSLLSNSNRSDTKVHNRYHQTRKFQWFICLFE